MGSLTSFRELSTCGICFELFNEDNRCPRVLKCGHTFCHSCLEKVLVQNSSCPMCKAKIQSHKVNIIPVNYVARGLICAVNQNNNPSEDTNSNKLESEGFCIEHSNDKHIRCMDCKSWICWICGMLNHKQCRTMLVKEAYKELKEQISDKVEKELEARKCINDKIEIYLKCLEEERKSIIEEIRIYKIKLKECIKKISNLNSLKLESSEFPENLLQVQTEAKTSKNETEFSKVLNKFDDLLIQGKSWLTQLENLKLNPVCPTTLEDLRNLSQERQEVYVVDNENEPLYGKVTLIGEQIRISSFSSCKPEGLQFPFKEFLQNFSGTSNLPNVVFMKISVKMFSQEHKEVDVVMETNRTSLITKNFALLCSGLKKQTYKGMLLNRNGPYLQLSSDIPPAVEGLIVDNYGVSLCQVGSIFGIIGSKSGFCIPLFSGSMGHHFGVVISGLSEIQQFYDVRYLYVMEDCGLVIRMNHKSSGETL